MMKKLAVITFALTCTQAMASNLESSCYSLEDKTNIEGLNINRRLPIASVSKLFTSYWAVSRLGLDFRYATRVYITPTEDNKFNIHLQGSRSPYFGKENLHYLISALNKMGVTKVQTLSFDENFKFIWDLNTPKTMWQTDYKKSSPSLSMVQNELESHISLLDGYQTTRSLAARKNVTLVAAPQFTYNEIKFVSKDIYRQSQDTKTFLIYSSPLQNLLKQMNKTSNNHAANQIFESIGGADVFNPFIKEKLSTNENQVTEADIRFLNGSGDNFEIESGVSEYNEASCTTVLKMLKSFNTLLQTKYKKSLKDVVAVVGGDSSYKGSINTTKYLDNGNTSSAVAAKTGTISPVITLGGVASTQKGPLYFFYNEDVDGTPSDQNNARKNIKLNLNALIKNMGGPKEFNYNESIFTPFDDRNDILKELSRMTPKNKNLADLLEDQVSLLPDNDGMQPVIE